MLSSRTEPGDGGGVSSSLGAGVEPLQNVDLFIPADEPRVLLTGDDDTGALFDDTKALGAGAPATTRQPPKNHNESTVLKLKGLPYSTTEDAIINFFHGFNVKKISFVFEPDGRPSGLAFAEFASKEDALKALAKNGEYIGERYVRLLHVPRTEMEEQVRLGTLAIPGVAAKLRAHMMRTQQRANTAIYGGGGAIGGGGGPMDLHAPLPQLLPPSAARPLDRLGADNALRLGQLPGDITGWTGGFLPGLYGTAQYGPQQQQQPGMYLGSSFPGLQGAQGLYHGGPHSGATPQFAQQQQQQQQQFAQQQQGMLGGGGGGGFSQGLHQGMPPGMGPPYPRPQPPPRPQQFGGGGLGGGGYAPQRPQGGGGLGPGYPPVANPNMLAAQLGKLSLGGAPGPPGAVPTGAGGGGAGGLLQTALGAAGQMPSSHILNRVQAALQPVGGGTAGGAAAAAAASGGGGGGSATLKIRGLPFRCSHPEIMAFFNNYQFLPDTLQIGMDSLSRPSGEAWLTFASPAEALRAMQDLNRHYIGSRYLELSLC